MNVNLVIGPPFCDQKQWIIHNDPLFKSSNFIDSKHLKKPQNDLKLDNSKDIIVLGLNENKQERNLIVNNLKYLFGELNISYLYMDVPIEKILYEMFLNDNHNILATYAYYDCLDISGIEIDNVEKIEIPLQYDELIKHGSSALIIDIHAFFLNSNNTKIMLSIPKKENKIIINRKLCSDLKQISEMGYPIILSHCENRKYSHINLRNAVPIYNTLFKECKFDIAGICSDLDATIENRLSKPNPWHLFNIFRDYQINPRTSVYCGYQSIDEKFTQHAGLKYYVNCSTPEKIGEIMNSFERC